MTAAARTRTADVAGGLEVRRTHLGRWAIHLQCGTALYDLTQPRQRNARAVRALLLAALPDWSDVTASGWPDRVTSEQRVAVAGAAGRVGRVLARQSRGCCLGCGHRACACGTDSYLDGPHYTAAELEWAR